ncbi:unnamed protein product [Triticum turgidum subsp. durum]|uniref:Reticulon-like protein n=1 Tax=Triticum turgidum subsp. durum TaxID=4567 RepID=A0A9R0WBN9_TRITD|nr:unnamed protein product [Triticum turgidum subsp. durum]
METSASGAEPANAGIEVSADPCSSAGGGHRLSVHQIVGGGKAADIILWKCKRATVGVIFGATIAWWLFEKSELSFLTICCDVLLILIVVRLFFQVVSVLWLLSVIGNFYSSVTLAYIGTIALVTVPVLYHRHQEHVDRYAGMVHRNISRHYKIVDENVISRLPRSFIRDKDD